MTEDVAKRKRFNQIEQEVEEYCGGDWALYLRNAPNKLELIKMMFAYKFKKDREALNGWARENNFRVKDFDVILGSGAGAEPEEAKEERRNVAAGALADIQAEIDRHFTGLWPAFLEAVENPVSILTFLLEREFHGDKREFAGWAETQQIGSKLINAVLDAVDDSGESPVPEKSAGGIADASLEFTGELETTGAEAETKSDSRPRMDATQAQPSAPEAETQPAPPAPAPPVESHAPPPAETSAPRASTGQIQGEGGLTVGDYLTVLGLSFPSLAKANPDGLSPFQPDILDAWAAGSDIPPAAMHATAFLVSLAGQQEPEVGRFDIVKALAFWDADHRTVFRTWLQKPYLP